MTARQGRTTIALGIALAATLVALTLYRAARHSSASEGTGDTTAADRCLGEELTGLPAARRAVYTVRLALAAEQEGRPSPCVEDGVVIPAALRAPAPDASADAGDAAIDVSGPGVRLAMPRVRYGDAEEGTSATVELAVDDEVFVATVRLSADPRIVEIEAVRGD